MIVWYCILLPSCTYCISSGIDLSYHSCSKTALALRMWWFLTGCTHKHTHTAKNSVISILYAVVHKIVFLLLYSETHPPWLDNQFSDCFPQTMLVMYFLQVKTDSVLVMLKKKEEKTWAYVTKQEAKIKDKK